MNPTGPEPPAGQAAPTPAPAAAPAAPAPAAAATPAPAPKPAPAPVAPPPPPPPLPEDIAKISIPFQSADYALKGFHAEATVQPDQVVDCARTLDQAGYSLDTITGVDWMAAARMEVIYDYFHPARCRRVAIRASIPRDNPEIATISTVFPGANWHERETHDFFGIRFLGHPCLTPFLLPEDATYHPLRKDFVRDAE